MSNLHKPVDFRQELITLLNYFENKKKKRQLIVTCFEAFYLFVHNNKFVCNTFSSNWNKYEHDKFIKIVKIK